MDTSGLQSVKLAMIAALGLSKDALHIYVGLAVFLLTALALRQSLRSLLPWLAVVVVALAGELFDALDDVRSLGREHPRHREYALLADRIPAAHALPSESVGRFTLGCPCHDKGARPMKRSLKRAAFAVPAMALLLVASVGSWYAFSAPPVENLPLAGDLIAISSAEGRQLLAATPLKTDYHQLEPFLLPQVRRAFCGPATSAAVINAALRP